MESELHEVLTGFRPVSLADLNARAALQQRVDRKYLISRADFVRLASRLHDDHQVLQIDGRRTSGYHSVYFDTPSLLCFREHVDGQRPRFKARTRHYTDTDLCHFEVKIRRRDEQMIKEQQSHDPARRDQLTEQARTFLDQTLREGADRDAPHGLRPALNTSFQRVTITSSDPARLTCDLQLRLRDADGRQAALHEDFVLLESKSPDGRSKADELLMQDGVDEVSLSKYRVGIALLQPSGSGQDPDPPLGDHLPRYFSLTRR